MQCNVCAWKKSLKKKKKIQGRCILCVGTQHVAKDYSTKGISGENCNRRHHRALCSCEGNELTNKNDTSDPCGNRCPRNTLCTPFNHESCKTGITERSVVQRHGTRWHSCKWNGNAGSWRANWHYHCGHYWKDLFGKLERLSEEVVGLDSKFSWLIQWTESMLNATSDREITDIGTLHVSVGLEEQINHSALFLGNWFHQDCNRTRNNGMWWGDDAIFKY